MLSLWIWSLSCAVGIKPNVEYVIDTNIKFLLFLISEIEKFHCVFSSIECFPQGFKPDSVFLMAFCSKILIFLYIKMNVHVYYNTCICIWNVYITSISFNI